MIRPINDDLRASARTADDSSRMLKLVIWRTLLVESRLKEYLDNHKD
jgi:hypothetical protein